MSFKKEFLDLLDKDAEFRYAVAGYLGLGDVIRRLDKQQETLERLLANIDKLWEENQKIWQELKSLREGQDKLWESNNKLWESNNKLWEEVKALREGENRLEATSNALSRKVDRLAAEVNSFGRAFGRMLEDYTSSFVKLILEDRGYDEQKLEIGRKELMVNGGQVEIDIFNEEPLVVGEVATYLPNEEAAKNEFEKLMNHVSAAESVYKKKAVMKLLSVGNAPTDAVDYLRKRCKEEGVTFVYGKELMD